MFASRSSIKARSAHTRPIGDGLTHADPIEPAHRER